jgi:isopentenyl phosphate kinase
LDERRALVAVVKLGGSIVTDKTRDFTYRPEAVASIARAVRASGVPVVVVHGGGSFGHPVAIRYGLSSRAPRASPEGVSETRRAMLDLNARVCGSLTSEGLRPYTFTPFPLLEAAGRRGAAWLRDVVSAGLTPVTFGDVVHDAAGFRVLSGDTIALLLSKTLGAGRCVFVMDVDGVMGPRGLLRELDRSSASRLELSGSRDATGGIALKVAEALRIASSGTEVAFVSGFRPSELSKALKGLGFRGTKVRVPSRG